MLCCAGNIPRNKTFDGKISRLNAGTEPFEIIQDIPINQIWYKWLYSDSVIIDNLPPGITVKNDISTGHLIFNGSAKSTGTYVIQLTSVGCANSVTISDTIIVLSSPTGYSPIIVENHQPLVYPNPSENLTFVSLDETKDRIKSIYMYNIQGILVHQEEFNNKPKVSINHHLTSGIYLIEINGLKSVYNVKLYVR